MKVEYVECDAGTALRIDGRYFRHGGFVHHFNGELSAGIVAAMIEMAQNASNEDRGKIYARISDLILALEL